MASDTRDTAERAQPRPLTAAEEAEMRHDLDPFDAYQYGGWAHLVGRLFATLDAARSTPSPDDATGLRAAFTRHLLVERGPDGQREHRCNELCADDLAALAASENKR